MTDFDPTEHTVDELDDHLETVDDERFCRRFSRPNRPARTARRPARRSTAGSRRSVPTTTARASRRETETEGEYEETREDVGEEAEGEDEAAETAAEGEPDEDADQEAEEDDDLSHPTRDKRHVRALEDGHYEDMWVFCETQGGELLEVAKEMLGKARELMDGFAEDHDEERVVAFLMGDDCEGLAGVYRLRCRRRSVSRRSAPRAVPPQTLHRNCVAHGPRRRDRREHGLARVRQARYVLFPATNNGRDLSAKVQAELDSGLASDCSDLFIQEEEVSNPVKTGEPGVKKTFEKVLHMKRPDFSGFEYSTILCLDNPGREFHPQASIIPGSFEPIEPDPDREGS